MILNTAYAIFTPSIYQFITTPESEEEQAICDDNDVSGTLKSIYIPVGFRVHIYMNNDTSIKDAFPMRQLLLCAFKKDSL